LHSDFSSSNLVRLLSNWTPGDGDASRMDFAERLGLWLNAFDAIDLQAACPSVLPRVTAAPGAASVARTTRAEGLGADLHKVRAALAGAITRDDQPMAMTTPEVALYSRYQERHLQLQRQMEQMITPLRAQLRTGLSQLAPRLRPLAALDAVFEKVLGPREQALLATVSAMLKRRFEQLQLAGAANWLGTFDREWQQALLAELDLRLEPVRGLVDALHDE
jgi:hypothetical protein